LPNTPCIYFFTQVIYFQWVDKIKLEQGVSSLQLSHKDLENQDLAQATCTSVFVVSTCLENSKSGEIACKGGEGFMSYRISQLVTQQGQLELTSFADWSRHGTAQLTLGVT